MANSLYSTHNKASQPADSIVVSRRTFTHSGLQEEYDGETPHRSALAPCRHCCSWSRCFRCMVSTFPFVSNLNGYSLKNDLPNDIVSGLTIGIMHIPQGMAYGMLASLSPVYGLYSSFFPVLIYFFLGTSKHISFGTSAVTTLMVGAACDKGYDIYMNKTVLPTLSPSHLNVDTLRLLLVLAITFSSGAIQFVMGVCRLGFVAIYLSDPLVGGFTTGAAFHVFASQLHHIFGIHGQRYSGPLKFFYVLIDMFRDIPTANPVTIVMALIAIVVMLVIKILVNARCRHRMKMPVPVELLVIILATVISYFARFHELYGVSVVGVIPRGLPAPILPGFNLLPAVMGDTVSISIIGFAITISLAKLFAKKHNYDIDANQELIAYGSSNMISSFFGCFVTSGALARSSVQVSSGGRTQVAGLVSCCLLLIVLFAVGPLFHALPNCILGAIIVVNLKGMFAQFSQLSGLWRICKYDFCIWLLSMLATLILDLDWGLLAGVLFSILSVLWRSRRSPCLLLGRLKGTDIYRDMSRYTTADAVPGVQIFQFGSSLYYANADYFRSQAYACIGVNPRAQPLRRCCQGMRQFTFRKRHPVIAHEPDAEERELTAVEETREISTSVTFNDDVHYRSSSTISMDDPLLDVVLDCSMMSHLDTMGIDALRQVVSEYEDIGVTVYLAALNDVVYDSLVKSAFFHDISPHNVLVSVHDAVTAAVSNRDSRFDDLDTDKDDHKPMKDGVESEGDGVKPSPEINDLNTVDEMDGEAPALKDTDNTASIG